MMHDIPVSVVVLGVEAGQPQGGGVGDSARQLLRGGATSDGGIQRGDDARGLVAEDGPGQRVDVLVPAKGPAI